MSAWRRIAIEKLPSLKETIEFADTIGMLWVDLSLSFEQAHREPIDESIIRGTYEFASWCIDEGGDIGTAAICHFYEHLPTDKRFVELLPRYMSRDVFLGLTDTFKYHLSAKEHADFVANILKRMQHNAHTPNLKGTK